MCNGKCKKKHVVGGIVLASIAAAVAGLVALNKKGKLDSVKEKAHKAYSQAKNKVSRRAKYKAQQAKQKASNLKKEVEEVVKDIKKEIK